MYTIVYKNGIKMRVVDKEMQKVIQSMNRYGIHCVQLIRQPEGTVVYTGVNKKKRSKA